ncbi:MAG: flap endonuclease-1, partial [Candidatus Aenigmatarchaeota archaeon]
MGIQLTSLLAPSEIMLKDLAGRRIAIDSFNWLYQFLSIIRGYDGNPLMDSKGRVTSHLSGFFYRSLNLLEAGIRPVFVFDGKPPESKKEEAATRHEARKKAHDEWKTALEAGELEQARKFAKRAVFVNQDMIDGAKALLSAMGFPVIQAPSEGEALCAVMVQNKDAWAVASQDYDSLLFGATRLIRNLSVSGKRKYQKTEWTTVNPEMLILKDVLGSLDLTQDQLIILGILIGTDFNPGGVHGIGPKKALALIKEKRNIKKVFEDLAWDFEILPEEIFDFFKKPPICKYDIKFTEPDVKEIRRILVDEHEFNSERVENGIKRLVPEKP